MKNVLDNVKFTSAKKAVDDDNFEIPMNISDILEVCKEYSRLGWQIQNQIEYISEMGIEESLKNGKVKIASLPLIKNFLKAVSQNPLFGDATEQADECVALIENYELTHPELKAMVN